MEILPEGRSAEANIYSHFSVFVFEASSLPLNLTFVNKLHNCTIFHDFSFRNISGLAGFADSITRNKNTGESVTDFDIVVISSSTLSLRVSLHDQK